MPEEPYDFGEVFQAVFIPKQKPAPPPVAEAQMAFISTYPPLGQITQFKNGEVDLHALLEVPKSLEQEPWELALWQSMEGGDWSETPLALTEQRNVPSCLQLEHDKSSRFYFSARLSIQTSLNFTVKFRQKAELEWRWIRDEQNMGDGTVVVDGTSVLRSTSNSLADIIHDLNPDLVCKVHSSQCPGTRLWSVEATVPGVEHDTSTYRDIPLGLPWGGFLRWFAVVRIWTPWLAPRHGKCRFELDKEAVLCSFLSPKGKHMVVLGVSGLSDTMTLFRSSDSGHVNIHVRHDEVTTGTSTALIAIGDDFESANAAVMYHARNLALSSKKSTGEFDAEMAALRHDVKPEWYENWYDGLGYCTWNALGQRLTHEKVIQAVDTLAEHKINITSLIIDDNWQDIDYKGDAQFQYGWNGFEAEPKAFPNGLKGTISEIRAKHKNIAHIAVWHALLGYWGGIAPNGELAKKYKTIQVNREDSTRRNLPLGGIMTVVAKEDVHRFYDDFYKFLESCGIDGVKTDAQFTMDTWDSATARRELMHTYLDAWTISSLRHFSIKVISCMSQTPQVLFYSQLPRNRPAFLCRNSDDFFPDIPSSHPWHVWTNAHNSLFTQHLNILPDWDMFQTVHDYSGFHAAARCVSGGPIYVTDVPGQHNTDLIHQMIGRTPRGKSVIFRPSVLGRSIDQYVGYDDDSLLKVGAYHGRAVTGTPILGVFNISSRSLTDIIPLARFTGVLSSMQYIVRSHTTGLVTAPVTINSPGSLLTVSLDVRGYEILTAFPLTSFHSEDQGQVFLANLGLLGKMSGAAAILLSSFDWVNTGRVFIDTRVKALGVLGIYISCLPDLSVGDFMVTIQGQPIPPHTVSVSKTEKRILEVDVEKAWDEMGLESGWSNEVEVKTYFPLEK